jgi:hypothetical protein
VLPDVHKTARDEHYCSMAIARWEAFTGGKAERVKA